MSKIKEVSATKLLLFSSINGGNKMHNLNVVCKFAKNFIPNSKF